MEKLLKIPCLSEDVELLQDDDIFYLYHNLGNTVLRLENETAVDIAKGIDGISSISSIIKMMMEKYQVSDIEELENDVNELLSILQRESCIFYMNDD